MRGYMEPCNCSISSAYVISIRANEDSGEIISPDNPYMIHNVRLPTLDHQRTSFSILIGGREYATFPAWYGTGAGLPRPIGVPPRTQIAFRINGELSPETLLFAVQGIRRIRDDIRMAWRHFLDQGRRATRYIPFTDPSTRQIRFIPVWDELTSEETDEVHDPPSDVLDPS